MHIGGWGEKRRGNTGRERRKELKQQEADSATVRASDPVAINRMGKGGSENGEEVALEQRQACGNGGVERWW
jgi:hypothetical protein